MGKIKIMDYNSSYLLNTQAQSGNYGGLSFNYKNERKKTVSLTPNINILSLNNDNDKTKKSKHYTHSISKTKFCLDEEIQSLSNSLPNFLKNYDLLVESLTRSNSEVLNKDKENISGLNNNYSNQSLDFEIINFNIVDDSSIKMSINISDQLDISDKSITKSNISNLTNESCNILNKYSNQNKKRGSLFRRSLFKSLEDLNSLY